MSNNLRNMEPTENKVINSDLCFLFQRFLSSSALKRTLKVFNEELEESKVLPTRTDWEGEQHDRTVEDMIRQFPNIRPDYLLYLCNQAIKSDDGDVLKDKTKSLLSFRPSSLNKNGFLTNFRQLFHYVTRKHWLPTHIKETSFNVVHSIRGREISGSVSNQKTITPKLFCSMQKQRTTVGHLSSVYCLLFDHSGKYIITGADDLLIKLWSTYTGRLISVFRGASSEIADIAVNPENTLLAAGSIDRILRVWNMQNGAPVAVLTGHTRMITSVKFCPTQCLDVRYLISTSTDGSIAFWPYSYENGFDVDFKNNPIMYQEKLRPGQAQMICSSFSPGGTFVATGSADHHVRVYYMKGDEGPHRILENEAHRDRVDSIQWAHSGLKLLSGSKDGTAIIWWFERQQWKSLLLDMATTVEKEPVNDTKKLKVTMVCWSLSDYCVVTAVSDFTIKIWTASDGKLIKILKGHTDEIYVLEAHPHFENIMLSAGHDGQLFIWDIMKGEILFKFLNTIEGQGFGSLYDVKWSPDGCVIAGSDSHGRILIFGFGDGSSSYQQLPQELFFHTDYRPLVHDTNHYVLDEQTQTPPHLMPPPFLVDIDGNPYPPMLQRLVPGRELCNVDQLVPNIVIGNEGTQEVIQEVPHNHIDQLEENNVDEGEHGSFRQGRRPSVRDHERIRQSTGNWQSDPSFEWQKNVLVKPLSKAILEQTKDLLESLKDAEMEEYQKQLRQRPHMISINTSNNVNKKYERERKRRKSNAKTQSLRYAEEEPESSENSDYETSGSSDWVADEQPERPVRSTRRKAANKSRKKDSDLEEEEEIEIEIYEDDDYNDDDFSESPTYSKKEGNHSKSKQKEPQPNRNRPSRKTRPKKNNQIKDSSSSSENEYQYQNGTSSRGKKTMSEILGSSTSGMQKSSKLTKLSEEYRLNEWLSETRPRKSPYYPQLGDEIAYFVQGHQLYLDAVEAKKVYEICSKDLPWNKMKIQPIEFCKVIGIQYEIKPPRLCCLKLALMDEEGHLTENGFSVKYHDMPDVLDFIVLKQIYNTAISRVWKNGSKFRCMIDDEWWIGEIINKSPASEAFPHSTFLCYQIRWNNGEEERMSPWDMEPVDNDRIPEDESQSVPVLEEELSSILYKTLDYDWPYDDLSTITTNIVTGLTKVMELAIAEPFLVPVDINVYPSYAMTIEYPIDLSTIKARFENGFYRRLIAAQFDIRYLAFNAEKFNEKHSIIVKHAKIITDLCLRIVSKCSTCIDVAGLYHRLLSGYESTDSNEIDTSPSTSKKVKLIDESNDWQEEALELIDLLCSNEDSIPFRKPVDLASYPDYQQIVKEPMDLGTVREKLSNDEYSNPNQFGSDLKLIFSNSRLYTPNRKSRIYDMTTNLSKIFEESFKKILSNWKAITNRSRKKVSSSEETEESMTSDTRSEEDDEDELDIDNIENDSEEDNNHIEENDKLSNKSESGDTSEGSKRITTRLRMVRRKKSEEEYCPRVSYKQSSSEDLSSDEEVTYKRKNNLRQRRNTKKIVYEDPDSDESSGNNRRAKRLKIESSNTSDGDSSNQSYQTDSNHVDEGKFISQVSSRGRVRKFTERAKAMFKKK